MKQLALAVVLTVAGSAFAQEIGTEITPTTPSSGVQTQETTPPPEEPKSGYVYKPSGSSAPAAPPVAMGNKLSASSGDFGIRAGFGSSVTPGVGTTGVAAPTVGIAYFAADAFKLLIDLGFGMAISNGADLSANALVGFDYLFRTPAEAMRPFVHVAASLGLNNLLSRPRVGVGVQGGFGAEYFFNPAFSVNGRLLLALPMSFDSGFALGVFTVTPGVGATWYL